MPSPFAARFAAAAPALDAVFGQAFTIRPMKRLNANGPPSADPDRPITTLLGIFDEPSVQDFPEARGHAATGSQQLGTAKASVTYSTAAVPYRVSLGDIVIKADGSGTFAVSDNGDDGLARTTLKLTAKS